MNEFQPSTVGAALEFGGDIQACEKYCVFQRRAEMFAFLATSVREVGLRPKIATVPGSDPMLAGLGHVRNEFFPFLQLNEPTVHDQTDVEMESQMIVISGDDGPWGLIVDRVIGLMPLEVSLTSDVQGSQGWQASVMGSAALEHQVVRVLDERALYRHATETLNRYWRRELQEVR